MEEELTALLNAIFNAIADLRFNWILRLLAIFF